MKIIKNFFLWLENRFWSIVIPMMSNSAFVHRIVMVGFRWNNTYKELNLILKVLIVAFSGWLVGFLIGAIFIS